MLMLNFSWKWTPYDIFGFIFTPQNVIVWLLIALLAGELGLNLSKVKQARNYLGGQAELLMIYPVLYLLKRIGTYKTPIHLQLWSIAINCSRVAAQFQSLSVAFLFLVTKMKRMVSEFNNAEQSDHSNFLSFSCFFSSVKLIATCPSKRGYHCLQ